MIIYQTTLAGISRAYDIDHDPTTTNTNAPSGSVITQYDDTGSLPVFQNSYIKQTDGDNTDVKFIITDAVNVGGFVEVFKDITDSTMNFRTLQSSNDTLTITQNTDDIDIKLNLTTLLMAASFNDQEPVAVDTALQIEYGAAQGSVSDPVSLAVDGTVTINEDGFYVITLGVQYGRNNVNLTAMIHFRALVNGTQVGNTATAVMPTDASDRPLSVTIGAFLTAGDELTTEVIRDSAGVNDGGLLSVSVTAAGWLDSPSASIRIFR